jgi:hypothetical protein
MATRLIHEFHGDHQKVVGALLELRQAIAATDLARIRSILASAEGLLGPHFKFEELHLYPALEGFLGESGVKRLLNEHDGVFRSLKRIVELAQKDAWSEADRRSAQENLGLIYEHPVSCDGLSLWLERLPEEQSLQLSELLAAVRKQGTSFSEYDRERRNA